MSSQTVKIEVTNVENVVVTSNGQEYMLVPKKDEIMEVEFEPSYVRVLSDDAQIGFTGGRIYPVIETDFNSGAFFKWRAVNDQNIERWISKENGIKATKLEYYTQEAKKRGFKKGVKFKCLVYKPEICGSDDFMLSKEFTNYLYAVNEHGKPKGVIYDTETDTWATIIPDEFERGELYVCLDNPELIVMCTGNGISQLKFSGTIIRNSDNKHVGRNDNDWSRRLFTPFTGTITL